jgi:hypothetical protein
MSTGRTYDEQRYSPLKQSLDLQGLARYGELDWTSGERYKCCTERYRGGTDVAAARTSRSPLAGRP